LRRLEKSACAHNDGGDNSGGGGGDSDGHAQCVCVVLAGARGAKGVCEAHARASCAQCARRARGAAHHANTRLAGVLLDAAHHHGAPAVGRAGRLGCGRGAAESSSAAKQPHSPWQQAATEHGAKVRGGRVRTSLVCCEHLSPKRPNGQGFCVNIGEKDSGHGVSSHSAAASSANLASSASSRDLRSS
jgi:hypothetical protein